MAEHFRCRPPACPLVPRYNLAPGQPALVVRTDGRGGREAALLLWGFLPSWAKASDPGARHINARAETAAERPAFRAAFRARRCLVPASGFYEWRPAGKRKQPYCVRRANGGLLAFAGLWERWSGAEGEIETFAILTAPARGGLRHLHPRAPAILPPEAYGPWLEGTPEVAAAALDRAVHRDPGAALVAYPVSNRINRVEADDADLIQPIPPPAAGTDERTGRLF